MAVVLITGTSSGLGLEAAVELARRGHQVVATMRDPGRSDALLQAAAEAEVPLDVALLDVTDDRSVRTQVVATCERYGRIDVLVNNAGMNWIGPLELMSDDDALRVAILALASAPHRSSREVGSHSRVRLVLLAA